MKRIVIPLLVVALLMLSACSSSTPPASDSSSTAHDSDSRSTAPVSDDSNRPPDTSSVVVSSPPASVSPVSSVPTEQTVPETPFEKFHAFLDDAGYAYETVAMGAELVGASAGEKYRFDFGTVELYQFDENSDA